MGKITEFKSGKKFEGIYRESDLNLVIDATYGPDYFTIEKDSGKADNYLKKLTLDGGSMFRRQIFAKSGDHLNSYNGTKAKLKKKAKSKSLLRYEGSMKSTV